MTGRVAARVADGGKIRVVAASAARAVARRGVWVMGMGFSSFGGRDPPRGGGAGWYRVGLGVVQ